MHNRLGPRPTKQVVINLEQMIAPKLISAVVIELLHAAVPDDEARKALAKNAADRVTKILVAEFEQMAAQPQFSAARIDGSLSKFRADAMAYLARAINSMAGSEVIPVVNQNGYGQLFTGP